MRPSARLVVPSREASAPDAARGLAVAISGGQAAAHAPEQALLPFLSFSKRYSVCPCGSTRIRPSDVVAVETRGPFACAARLADAGARADASVARIAALPMSAPRERWWVSMVCSFVAL